MTSRLSIRAAVNGKCKSCVYDPTPAARGGWREQVADCGGISCDLYPVRPVPRECMTNGQIDEEKVAELRRKLSR